MALAGVKHTPTLDVADVQGLVVRGYGRLPHATFLVCAVRDPAAARAFLRDRIDDVTTGLGPAAGTRSTSPSPRRGWT